MYYTVTDGETDTIHLGTNKRPTLCGVHYTSVHSAYERQREVEDLEAWLLRRMDHEVCGNCKRYLPSHTESEPS